MTSRFWEKVDVRGDDDCWPWKGGRFSTGYGRYHIRGKNIGAHRVALGLKLRRVIGDGMCAIHTCDNKICVNPQHLREGTIADNVADMDAKGRRGSAYGSANGRAKLSDRDVRKIRQMSVDGYTQRDIANAIGITQPTVSKIITRKTWRHNT